MPKEGWKSLTLKESVYNDLERIYKKNELDLGRQGVNSLSAFATKIIYEIIEDRGDNLVN